MAPGIEELYTVGEFSAKAGITQRTIRYYDKIGLLCPSSYNSLGHRLYSKQDFARLQKILTLKFIGLSLEDIAKIVKYDINETDFKKSLEIQRDIMSKKVIHMQMVMDTLDETLHMLHNENILNWDKFINIIKVINIDKNWLEQYEDASNLKSRIKLHESFSTNKHGWMRWFFEQLSLHWNARILEVGCGDASLWVKNIDRIPDGWDITISDFSSGMLKDAKENLGSNSHRFKFKLADAESIPFDDSSFDLCIANHMLYHVQDIEKALREIYRVLKPGGYIYASTVGRNHMSQMREIIEGFNSDLITVKSWEHTSKFQLENGAAQISKLFKNVKLQRYEDSLLVTEAAPIIDYIFSMPGNAREIVTQHNLLDLRNYLENKIKETGGIHIIKDTGFFQALKI